MHSKDIFILSFYTKLRERNFLQNANVDFSTITIVEEDNIKQALAILSQPGKFSSCVFEPL